MKIKVNGFVHMERGIAGEITAKIWACDMSSCGYFLVGEQEFEVEIPDDFDLTLAEIATLKKEAERLRKEFNDKVRSINDRISKLQAIEYSPGADDV